MLILVIGDPHFQISNLDTMEKATDEILSIVEERHPDRVIVMGDTLHTHERIHVRVQSMAIKFFKRIADKCELVVLIGNHDRESNTVFQTDIHPFVALSDTKNITIVSTATWNRKDNFLFVPYVAVGRHNEALETVEYKPDPVEKEHPWFIFNHQEIKDCV